MYSILVICCKSTSGVSLVTWCVDNMTSLGVLLLVLVLLSCGSSFTEARDADNKQCPSQWCGRHNISHPFWLLQDSSSNCGLPSYSLSCEDGQLLLYWRSGKFNVQSINYNNYTIRLVDANVYDLHNNTHDYSSLAPFSFTYYNFSSGQEPYDFQFNRPDRTTRVTLVKQMLYLRCANALGNAFYVTGFDENLGDLELGESCRIEWMYPTSWPAVKNRNHSTISSADIHNVLLYGFELSWAIGSCQVYDWYHISLDHHNNLTCYPYDTGDHDGNHFWQNFGYAIADGLYSTIRPIIQMPPYPRLLILAYAGFYVLVKFTLGPPLLIILCIYKWRRKHLSMYENIEDFLQSDSSIMPIRYSYKDIKSITEGFRTKLGNGGYGSVFRGKLRSGRLVAVKVLNKTKSNGQDFINEVATIGRIHHVNVVQLIGFCVEGSKRALIFELMENGSLEKYIFSDEESASLSREKLYAISLGVARGIEYLHNGCDMKILHFDIKPHNILLDDNFNPKVSDFGLARLYPTDNSIVSLTAARGTIGYMAPELFYRNVGAISYKADVYSFGMLLMEMAGRRKNLNARNEHSSQIYFPFWVYDQLHDGKEIAIENDTDEEMKLAKKMMVVALWCIQTKPSERPSMDKVVEMLEQADEGSLQMPPKPYFYDPYVPAEDVADDSNSRLSSDISVSDSNETSV